MAQDARLSLWWQTARHAFSNSASAPRSGPSPGSPRGHHGACSRPEQGRFSASGVGPISCYEEAEQGATDSRMCLSVEMHRQTWTSKQPCPTRTTQGADVQSNPPEDGAGSTVGRSSPFEICPSQAGSPNPTYAGPDVSAVQVGASLRQMKTPAGCGHKEMAGDALGILFRREQDQTGPNRNQTLPSQTLARGFSGNACFITFIFREPSA